MTEPDDPGPATRQVRAQFAGMRERIETVSASADDPDHLIAAVLEETFGMLYVLAGHIDVVRQQAGLDPAENVLIAGD